MKTLTERIRGIISATSDSSQSRKKLPFDFIRTRKGIIRELLISKESENMIGVLSPSLGEGMFLILVRSVESQNLDENVAFQVYDIKEGRFQALARLTVNEIKGVCPFVHNPRVYFQNAKVSG
jgi:hypothetical protein